jgi:hypothetical protein
LEKAFEYYRHLQEELAREAKENPERALATTALELEHFAKRHADGTFTMFIGSEDWFDPRNWSHVDREEILREWFGLLWRDSRGDKRRGEFSVRLNGENYNRAHASYYRSVKALIKRGLLFKNHHDSLQLTQLGIDTCRLLFQG